jgi:hypothetical protein
VRRYTRNGQNFTGKYLAFKSNWSLLRNDPGLKISSVTSMISSTEVESEGCIIRKRQRDDRHDKSGNQAGSRHQN